MSGGHRVLKSEPSSASRLFCFSHVVRNTTQKYIQGNILLKNKHFFTTHYNLASSPAAALSSL